MRLLLEGDKRYTCFSRSMLAHKKKDEPMIGEGMKLLVDCQRKGSAGEEVLELGD